MPAESQNPARLRPLPPAGRPSIPGRGILGTPTWGRCPPFDGGPSPLFPTTTELGASGPRVTSRCEGAGPFPCGPGPKRVLPPVSERHEGSDPGSRVARTVFTKKPNQTPPLLRCIVWRLSFRINAGETGAVASRSPGVRRRPTLVFSPRASGVCPHEVSALFRAFDYTG